MDSTARSSYVSTLPSKGTGKGETWEHTQSPEHRGHISVRETNFESDATLRISFSMWRVLNKSNSTAGDSMGDGCTITPVSVPQAEYQRALEKEAAARPSVPQGESHLCFQDGVGVTASRSELEPISEQASSSGDACGGDDGGRRQRPDLGRM